MLKFYNFFLNVQICKYVFMERDNNLFAPAYFSILGVVVFPRRIHFLHRNMTWLFNIPVILQIYQESWYSQKWGYSIGLYGHVCICLCKLVRYFHIHCAAFWEDQGNKPQRFKREICTLLTTVLKRKQQILNCRLYIIFLLMKLWKSCCLQSCLGYHLSRKRHCSPWCFFL